MARQSPTFTAITCADKECQAIIFLMSPGAIIYATKVRCPLCSKVRTIYPLDSHEQRVYTTLQPA